ncbi:4-hydroxy-tetrahydrodipicolinate reductase [Sporomusaceae bacterium BoRhaA]|uniref:4-hydroxy-tetrahydrodipicolinate reductase n=1 Tax=Pelorhabdus rhamnosifermentans TaxID=2772457 RepID=UPI001C062286|nr:4-hydroxy-tetrahydrodipicolinate reductase [Pelorhabdus rhamnosifermentans]MBU2701946.1 4-hydroxy-tetrahydrodipicolinate reductase [Pelorhabdus rhamnosifermentans]
MNKVKVMVSGACGRMGQEVMRAVLNDDALELVGAVDVKNAGTDVGTVIGKAAVGIKIGTDLVEVIKASHAEVMVDFTSPSSVMKNIRLALQQGVCPIVGTTGLSTQDVAEVKELCQKLQGRALIAPNFAIGAILLMQMSVQAAKYLPHVEIIELHHDQKLDAPSGTALRTAELIAEVRGTLRQGHPDEKEKLPGSRGGNFAGIPIHSVRLPGYVANQEVIFGGLGQTLTIRHDSISRESFMPGVTLACRKASSIQGLMCGLENLLD